MSAREWKDKARLIGIIVLSVIAAAIIVEIIKFIAH